MRILWIGRLRNNSILDRIRCDQLAFTTVPLRKDFGRGGTPQDAGVYQSRETNMWNVSGGAEYALKVPNGFCTTS